MQRSGTFFRHFWCGLDTAPSKTRDSFGVTGFALAVRLDFDPDGVDIPSFASQMRTAVSYTHLTLPTICSV